MQPFPGHPDIAGRPAPVQRSSDRTRRRHDRGGSTVLGGGLDVLGDVLRRFQVIGRIEAAECLRHLRHFYFAAIGATVDVLAEEGGIFNIGGNTYRPVVRVSYSGKRVVIKSIATSAEYDKIDVGTV